MFAPFQSLIRRCFVAWLAAARDVLPGILIYPGRRSEWSRIVTATEVSDGKPDLSGALVDIIVPSADCMSYDVEVPRSAARRAPDILSVNLRQQAAVPVEDLASTSAVIKCSAENVVHRQFVLRRSRLEELKENVREHGGLVRTICLDLHGAEPFFDQRSRVDRPVILWWATAATALIAAAGAWAWSQEREIAALQALVAQVEAENTAIRAYLREQTDRSEAAQVQIAQFEAALARLRAGQGHAHMLHALSEALPDGVWTTELALSGTDGRLTGFAKRSVPALVSEIATVPRLSTLSLSGPVTTDRQRGVHRFEAVWSKGPQS